MTKKLDEILELLEDISPNTFETLNEMLKSLEKGCGSSYIVTGMQCGKSLMSAALIEMEINRLNPLPAKAAFDCHIEKHRWKKEWSGTWIGPECNELDIILATLNSLEAAQSKAKPIEWNAEFITSIKEKK